MLAGDRSRLREAAGLHTDRSERRPGLRGDGAQVDRPVGQTRGMRPRVVRTVERGAACSPGCTVMSSIPRATGGPQRSRQRNRHVGHVLIATKSGDPVHRRARTPLRLPWERRRGAESRTHGRRHERLRTARHALHPPRRSRVPSTSELGASRVGFTPRGPRTCLDADSSTHHDGRSTPFPGAA